ncbi:MAG: cupin domain-containing protein [Halobacteria archaeon]|nr:cupin domain-containing protein [Halobacteria archaeon]
MESGVLRSDSIERTDVSNMGVVAPEVGAVNDELGTDEVRAKLWYFGPDDETQYHSHSEQEELFYVVEGEFEVKVEGDGGVEEHGVSSGDFYYAGKGVKHGHRYVGDDEGVILGIGAPAVDDLPDDWQDLDEV